MVRVLCTGSKGFVASHLFASLKDEERIGLARDSTDSDEPGAYAIGDLRDTNYVNRVVVQYNPDVVIHTASSAIVNQGLLNPHEMYSSNVLGTLNLLEACKKLENKKLYLMCLGTDKVLSDGQDHKESDPYLWDKLGVYEQSKAMQEALTLRYARFFDICIVRSCNIYGPGDTNSRIVPNEIRRALSGQAPRAYNRDKRQYIYVDDVVSAFHALLEKRKTGIWHIGTSDVLDCIQVCQTIADEVSQGEWKVELVEDDRESHKFLWYIHDQSLSYAKIQTEIGWKPLTPFAKGIAETVKWWKGRLKRNI